MTDNRAGKIIVVGMGPGHRDYVLPAALVHVRQARFLAGGQRLLQDYAAPRQQTWTVDGDLTGLAEFLRRAMADNPVVMVSGDPGFYSLLDFLRRQFPPSQLLVIPGISSMQMAFSRIGLPWQEAVLTSAHGRPLPPEMLTYAQGKTLGLLTDPRQCPARLAEIMLQAGWPAAATVWICERLSYPEERVVEKSLAETVALAGFGHSVMIVRG